MSAYLSVLSFFTAFMVFSIQFAVGKVILSQMGGSFSVWTTISFFFQLLLFIGYVYAGLLTSVFSFKNQIKVHSIIILVTFIALFSFSVTDYSGVGNPIVWIISTLGLLVGLPYLLITTTSPLIQKWFSYSDYKNAKDPYFLYIASNIGSFFALLSYPFAIEPISSVEEQVLTWKVLYALISIAIIISGCVLYKNSKVKEVVEKTSIFDSDGFSKYNQAIVVLFAFITCSLSLATTTNITTNISSGPIVWIVPLMIYLFSFIIGFKDIDKEKIRKIIARCFIVFIIIFIGTSVLSLTATMIELVLNLGYLFFISYILHAYIYHIRPDSKYLTRFYILISFGSLLGSVFNSLLAPVIFNTIFEYKLMLVVAVLTLCLCSGFYTKDKNTVSLKSIVQVVLFISSFYILFILIKQFNILDYLNFNNSLKNTFALSFMIVYFAAICQMIIKKQDNIKYLLLIISCLLVVHGIAKLYDNNKDKILLEDRSFYNAFKVKQIDDKMILVSGNTVHGKQRLDKDNWMYESYYTIIKDIINTQSLNTQNWNVGMVGLGAGVSLCFSTPQQNWKVFEIDQLSYDIAKNEKYFNYISNCYKDIDVIIGDARITLQKEDYNFDLLILDAFSSDSIPVHLLTNEAFDIYTSKIKKGGLVAFHISNRFLDLEPVIHNLAQLHNLKTLYVNNPDNEQAGSLDANWIVLSADEQKLEVLKNKLNSKETYNKNNDVIWTDNYTDLISVLKI